MRKIKLILGLLCALALVFALPVSASGVSIDQTNVIVKPTEERSSYEAHNILSIEESNDGSSVIYSVNEAYRNVLEEVVPSASHNDIPGYIAGLKNSEMETFANELYRKIKEAGIEPYATADNINGEADFGGIPDGYILVGQTAAPDQSPFSAVMLNTVHIDEILYVTPKTDVPTIDKKVLEQNDSAGEDDVWQDAADHDAGDVVSFQISITLPDNLDSYKTYPIEVHDTLANTLSYGRNATMYAISEDGGKTEVTNYFQVTNNGTSNVTFSCDIKANEQTSKAKSIQINYTATLSSNPTLGTAGNPNAAYLKYPRNPSGSETGETPTDKVTIFSYQVKVNKIKENQQPLEGATFELYKYSTQDRKYLQVGPTLYGGSEFLFKGLDAGKYKLVEASAPTGYNTIADIEFTIEATYETTADDPALTDLVAKNPQGQLITGEELTFSNDVATGVLSTKVVNKTGAELPSTGDQGTFLMYLCGGILLVAGCTAAILKRRSDRKRKY